MDIYVINANKKEFCHLFVTVTKEKELFSKDPAVGHTLKVKALHFHYHAQFSELSCVWIRDSKVM